MVLPEHAGRLEVYLDRLYRFGPPIAVVIGLGVLVYALSGFFGSTWLDSISLFAIGSVLCVFPYCTTLVSLHAFGARNIMAVSRIAGLALVGYSVFLIST